MRPIWEWDGARKQDSRMSLTQRVSPPSCGEEGRCFSVILPPPPKLLPRESPLQARLCLKAWTEGFLSSNDLTLYQQVAEGCWDSILRKTRKTLSQGLSCINES